MAAPLSTQDQANVRWYLGYRGMFFQVDSQLEQAMGAIATDNNLCTLIQGAIAECQTIDALITSAWRRLRYESAEDIRYRGIQEIMGLRMEGRRFVGRIAASLACRPRADAFGSGGSNDNFAIGMFADRPGGNGLKMG